MTAASTPDTGRVLEPGHKRDYVVNFLIGHSGDPRPPESRVALRALSEATALQLGAEASAHG